MIQIFEVLELREFPYFLTIDVEEGEKVRDILTDINGDKVYLLVDHDTKKIWTYNSPNSYFKLQIYGGILAGKLRKQLRGFYRVYPLNKYSKEEDQFQEILNKPLGPGRARSINKDDFSEEDFVNPKEDLFIHSPNLSKALENINEVPKPDIFYRVFIVVGGIIYSEEEIPESILNEEMAKIKIIKMGGLNNGFTFFDDRNYSTRIIVKDRAIQGIELYVHYDDEMPSLRIKTPIIEEEKISKKGKVVDLINAFHIPDSLPDIDSLENDKQN
jgi:hypothetical protein